VGGGEHHGESRALRVGEQPRAREAGGVEHGADVRGAILEAAELRVAFRQARPTLVEDHAVCELAQPGVHPGERWEIPDLVEVRRPAGDHHEIDWTAAEPLVGDVVPAAVGVAHA
jgi:hypothetical protein